MRVAMTGADGFLGWHTRAALRERGLDARGVPVGGGFDPAAADDALSGASRLIHLAGVNRSTDDEVALGIGSLHLDAQRVHPGGRLRGAAIDARLRLHLAFQHDRAAHGRSHGRSGLLRSEQTGDHQPTEQRE